jgi:hypothetical protein
MPNKPLEPKEVRYVTIRMDDTAEDAQVAAGL